MVKKILIWGGVAFLVYFIAYEPTGAAAGFKALWGVGHDIFDGFGDFLSKLPE